MLEDLVVEVSPPALAQPAGAQPVFLQSQLAANSASKLLLASYKNTSFLEFLIFIKIHFWLLSSKKIFASKFPLVTKTRALAASCLFGFVPELNLVD